LQQGATAAAATLLKVMLDQTTPASVRSRAAECVMNHSSKAIEVEEWKRAWPNWNGPLSPRRVADEGQDRAGLLTA
jgi:hypothetical protein